MNTMHSIFVCALGGALMVSACSVGEPETSGVEENAPPAASNTESLTMQLENQVALAERIDEDELFVQIFSEQGTLRFSVELRPGAAEAENVHWQIHEGVARDPEGQEVSAGNLSVPFDELPPLEQGITVAAYLQKQIAGSLAGQEHDNWGCDLPITWVASCGGFGLCCDIHDACYSRFHCSSSSWYNPFASTACKACNAAVVACISGGVRGPSVCCFLGNCGQPR